MNSRTLSMARTAGKIAEFEATVAALQQDYHFLEERVKSIEGKNPPLEARVKALMDKNQNLQIKMLCKMDNLREAFRGQQTENEHKSAG